MKSTSIFDKIRIVRGDIRGVSYIIEDAKYKRPESTPQWSLRLPKSEVWELFLFLLEEFTGEDILK